MFRPTYLQLFRKDEEELGVETICVSALIFIFTFTIKNSLHKFHVNLTC